MSDAATGLRRKIHRAGDLQAVVRTMKALAASSIGQYEQSVRALGDYYRTVELGLAACFRESAAAAAPNQEKTTGVGAIVFGSDQGLVGQFNEVVADYALATLRTMPGTPLVWAVGERVHARLTEAGLKPAGLFKTPNSVKAITPLIGRIQLESEAHQARIGHAQVYVFHNRPQAGALYEPVSQRLLPLDAQWRRGLAQIPWPTHNLPEVMHDGVTILGALIREYLFISLFKACAESLASENASRLAAMQRAEENIGDLLEELTQTAHRVRQSTIDEELFDVISGYESAGEGKAKGLGRA